MLHDRIAVVDFGGQYAHLIATKVRRLNVRADILDPLAPLEEFRAYRGIILSGSPALSSLGEGHDYTRAIYDLPIPILGFCFGHQEIAKHYGGQVKSMKQEYGFSTLHLTTPSPIFDGLGPDEIVWMSHGDSVTRLPEGFVELGYSMHIDSKAAQGERAVAGRAAELLPAEHRYAAIANETLKRYGFQFHPEVDDTEHGQEMLRNFAVGICGCEPTWTIENYIAEEARILRERVGDQKVFLLVSGGVDSTVCARLLVEALGAGQVHMLHIDNGLMRKDESRQVVERFRRWGVTENLHFVDASEEFLSALAGVAEPESKRLVIGTTFIEVSEREMEKLDVRDALLAQGTIYPDTIETGGTSRADVIKTHHNRVPLVEEMIRTGRVLEPIKELYKVEVRELGADLGIDRDFLDRHPFPGPGLGVRLLCNLETQLDAATASSLTRISRESDVLARERGLRAVAIPVKSVGVKADLRSYEWPVLLCGPPGMVLDPPSWSMVLEVANRIYKEVAGVNRCVFDLTGRATPPRIDRRVAAISRARLDLLREADALMMGILERYDLMNVVWQCPTVMLPAAVEGAGDEFVVVRPVLSERAMTARPAPLPALLLEEVGQAILALPGVSGAGIDVSTKPPGTIEWE
jgi:GMP synthase (glutamine-hydrolysing)